MRAVRNLVVGMFEKASIRELSALLLGAVIFAPNLFTDIQLVTFFISSLLNLFGGIFAPLLGTFARSIYLAIGGFTLILSCTMIASGDIYSILVGILGIIQGAYQVIRYSGGM